MTATPRTDAYFNTEWTSGMQSRREFAGELERELIAMTSERDALLRNEYICAKCGIRKDDEHPKGDF